VKKHYTLDSFVAELAENYARRIGEPVNMAAIALRRIVKLWLDDMKIGEVERLPHAKDAVGSKRNTLITKTGHSSFDAEQVIAD
jgi:hypothetical protein